MNPTSEPDVGAPTCAELGRVLRVAANYLPRMEGMRAVAALGVLLTHVSFQTGLVDGSIVGRALGRLDLAVAMFFGISGFLLWRPHARAARSGAAGLGVARYLRSRAVRILPSYLACVIVVLMLLPSARDADLRIWLANLSLTQVYVPYTLTYGLTQMWSLAVEVSFYLVLPLVGWLLLRVTRHRVPLLLAIGVAFVPWAWIGARLPLRDGVNPENWLPAFVPWFVAGLVLAEWAVIRERRSAERATAARLEGGAARIESAVAGIFGARRVAWPIAAALFAIAASELGGPVGIDSPSHTQFATRIAVAAVMTVAILGPIVLNPDSAPGLLGSEPAQAVGRWSYGIFVWHLLVLESVFPLLGIIPFTGSFVLVLFVTVAGSLAVAAASFACIEEPARMALVRWERSRHPSAPVTGPPELARPRTDGALARGIEHGEPPKQQ